MTAIIENIKIIKNSNKIKIFKLPQNTLLDNILIDLWSCIIKYEFPYCFTLCEYDDEHPGFRSIIRSEFEKIKPIFLNFYEKNGGIPDIFNIKQNKFSYLSVDGYCVTCKKSSSKCIFSKNEILLDDIHDAYINPYAWIGRRSHVFKYLRLIVSDNFENSM